MSSFVSEGVELLGQRINELNVLLTEANNHSATQSNLYDALCRSIQVLSVAHFEGYLKDLARNILDDINTSSSFKLCSQDLKFTYCKNFIQPLASGKPNHTKILELIAVLDELDTKFVAKHFYAANKNPKESIVNTLAENFGESGIFLKLNNSELAQVFSNTDGENVSLRNTFKQKVLAAVSSYPYIIDPLVINISAAVNVLDKFWETFIQTILTERHKIAHGDINNTIGHSSISANVVKMEILLLGITYILSQKGNPTH